jgi:hypothetical protein
MKKQQQPLKQIFYPRSNSKKKTVGKKYRLPSHKECYYEAVSLYGNRPPTIVGERRLRPSTIGAAVQFHGNTVVTAIP